MQIICKLYFFRECGKGKLEGYFKGDGEKLGVWDAFTEFWGETSSKMGSLWAGLQVASPGAADGAVLVRILSGKKTGGAALRNRSINPSSDGSSIA